MKQHHPNDHHNALIQHYKAKFIHAACILALAYTLGPDPNTLSGATGIGIDEVSEIVGRMRAAGLWASHNIDTSEWFGVDPKDGQQAFYAQAALAAGLVLRIVSDSGPYKGV